MNTNVIELISTAKNYKAEQQPLKAITTYKQALKYEPNNALVLALLGTVQKEQGNLSDAIANFQKAINLQPNSISWIHSSLGSALQAQDKYVEATQAYYEAIILDSEAEVPVWVWQSLGHVLMEQERWNEAIEIYTKALKTHPNNTNFHNNLKRSQIESQKKIQQAEKKKNVYYDLGKKLAQEGKWQEAIVSLRQAIELQPKNYELYQELAKALIQQGKIDAGIIVLQKSYKLAPDSASENRNSIYQQSIASWEKAVKNTPQNLSDLELRRGNVLGSLGLNQEAALCHNKAIILSGKQWKNFPERNYQFTYNFFAHNIPVWVKHLSRFADQPGINALEIGSWQGMSSCWLLDNILTHSDSTITCIDLGVRPQFKSNITATGAEQKVTLITAKSEVGLKNLPVEQYNFIYIDGGHLSFEVIQDTLLAWDLIKEGGVIIFDDYDWKPPENPEYGPKLAIDLFTDLFKNEIEILHHGWQVIVKKTSQRISFAHDFQK